MRIIGRIAKRLLEPVVVKVLDKTIKAIDKVEKSSSNKKAECKDDDSKNKQK